VTIAAVTGTGPHGAGLASGLTNTAQAFLVGAGFAVAGAILAFVLISSQDSREHSVQTVELHVANDPAAVDEKLRRAGISANTNVGLVSHTGCVPQFARSRAVPPDHGNR
jgi:hypothetical protein